MYLAFENFGNETLEYDPTLGIIPSTDGALDITTIALIGGAVVAVIIIVVVIKKR